MTAPDLLPCPFCGCEPDGHEGSHVSCRCGAMGPLEIAGDPESPTWNTRATPAAMTPTEAQIDAALDAIRVEGPEPPPLLHEMDAAMTPEVEALVEAAEKTRAAQKAYFRDRTRENLIASKQAEAELDAVLATLRAGGDG